jgi:hypothetical protein
VAGVLSAAQLATVRHDLTTSDPRVFDPPRQVPCQGPPATTSGLLVGRDAWGDEVALDVTCGFYRAFWPAQRTARFVHMLPATRAMVASLPGA